MRRNPEKESVKALVREGGVRRMEVRGDGDGGQKGRGARDRKLDRDKEKGVVEEGMRKGRKWRKRCGR